MIVAASQIAFQSYHQSLQQQTVEEKMRVWVGPRPEPAPALPEAPVSLELSSAALAACQASARETEEVLLSGTDDETWLDPKLRLTKLLVEKLTGRKVRLLSPAEMQTADRPESVAPGAETDAQAADPGYGAEYDRRTTTYQMEQSTVQAQGVVRTQDGKEIKFSLNLQMQWEYVSDEQVSVRLGNAVKDPLVVNFDGRAAELSDTKVDFNLDGDQRNESVSCLKPHSGFLVLDANQDGLINSGLELFGPRTGDGWAELRAYDSDQNHWIDAADGVYNQLRVWSRDEQGRESLRSLDAAGVGAIYLEAAATAFALRGESRQVQGQVKSTGVYLAEDGSAGSMQQVDLAVG